MSIHIPAKDSPASNILLTGENDASLQACKRDIERIIGLSISDKPLETATFNIDPRLFGLIIGTGGNILRQLETETACSITIPQRDTNEPVVAEGTRAGIAALEQKFSKLLGEPIRANSRPGSQVVTQQPASSGGIFSTLSNIMQDTLHIGSGSSSTSTSNVSRVNLRNVKEVLFFPESDLHPGHFERFLELLRSATRSIDGN